MCIGCWHENGSPAIFTEKTRRAAELVQRIYEFSCVGGNAHIVTDDWNLEDHNIDWCLNNTENIHEAGPEQLAAERECLLFLRGMTMDERYSAMAISDGAIVPVIGTDEGHVMDWAKRKDDP